jgi:hypothetical protein
MTDPWTAAFNDIDLLPGLTGLQLGGADGLGVDPFDIDLAGGGGLSSDQPSGAGDRAGNQPPEVFDDPPAVSSEVTGDNTVVTDSEVTGDNTVVSPFPREAVYVGEATVEPSVDDHGASFGAGVGTFETTVNPLEIPSDLQLDLSEATFSSADDDPFGSEVVGEGMVVEVRDHRNDDPVLPPGTVGDGEPVVRDHRESPLDDLLDGPF